MSTVVGYDCTTGNLAATPAGQLAGYATGAGVAWTTAQFAAHPGTVVIDQDPSATDHTADVLDVENGAATVGDVVAWVKLCLASYAAGTRPGQRKPAIYVNQSNITAVANALSAASLTGIGLWLANYNYNESGAAAVVAAATGPYPLVAIQYNADINNAYDEDVFSVEWLSTQSGDAGDTISEGSSGPAVVAAQQRINVWAASAKLPQLTVDGLFGTGTLTAIKAFQVFSHLTEDGIIGTATWAALDKSPTPVDPPPPAPKPFAAPGEFKYGNVNLDVSWEAAPAVNGKSPTGYTLQVILNGKSIGTKVVTGTSSYVTLAVGKSYTVNVWANGGPVAPPHSTFNVTV